MSFATHRRAGLVSSLLLFAGLATCTADSSSPAGGAAGDGGGGQHTGSTSTGGSGGGTGGSTGGTGGTGGSKGGTGGTGGTGGVLDLDCEQTHPPVTTPLPPSAPVTASIDVGTVTCRVAPDFSGMNYVAFADWGADISMSSFQRQAFQSAGVQMLRYPGGVIGEWVDLLMTSDCTDGSPANWGSPPYKSLWSFAEQAGIHSLMLQTNPTTQWCGSGDQDASGQHAAAMAADAKAHGVRAVYEIGNEPDLEYFGNMANGRAAYIDKFIEHANAIHGADATAEVYGPGVCGLGAWCSFPTTWDTGFIEELLQRTGNLTSGPGAGSIDGISFHVYLHPDWGFSDLTEAGIDKYGVGLHLARTVVPYLRAQIAQYDTRRLAIAISEISVGSGSTSSNGQNMYSVLETLDVLASVASAGVRSVQWFDANQDGGNDWGALGTSAARPIYYAFVGWSKMGDQILDVDASANPDDLAVFATRRNDGSVQVLVLNKTATSHAVTLSFSGWSPAGKSLRVYTASPSSPGDDASTSVVYNGQQNPSPTALPAPATSVNPGASATETVPAYSFAVLSFDP